MTTDKLTYLREQLKTELYENILPFWSNHTIDEEKGGFYGRITNDLNIDKKASKGLILNTRILWTFSRVYNFSQKRQYLNIAERGFDYLMKNFNDRKYNGFFWRLDFQGNTKNDLKKSYGQAFSIYSLAEFYKASKNVEAKKEAIRIFTLLEKHAYDDAKGGYFEVCNRDWKIADDQSLSPKDMNVDKSMNTHLHILEAYTNLYKIWPDRRVKKKLIELVNIFIDHIIDHNSYHLRLFFDKNWENQSKEISFGHDIECSWLLLETVQLLDNQKLQEKVNKISLKMVQATLSGFNKKGGLYSGLNQDKELKKDFIWWIQAEALVGLLNAYQLSHEKSLLEKIDRSWQFIKNNIVDNTYGEWFYKVSHNFQPYKTVHKVSNWKGPYHNSRACLQLINRIHNIKEGVSHG